MIQIEKVEQLITFLLGWAITQMHNSPSTQREEIVMALRKAADKLEAGIDELPDAFKRMIK